MFYLLYGRDTYRSREKLKELLNHFKTKISDLGVFRIEGEGFKEAEFEEILKAKNLFEKKNVVVCEGAVEDKLAADFVMANLEKCAKSENIFLFLEEEIGEKVLEEFKKHAAKAQEFDLLKGSKLNSWFASKKVPANIAGSIIKKCGSDLWCASKEIEKHELGGQLEVAQTQSEYNPFAICDAFAEKNKVKAWIILQQALTQGIAAEEVFFKILWQVKNLLMVKKLNSAEIVNIAQETGLHPFVAGKALRASKNFTEEELENYSAEMVRIYHQERRGEGELEIEFEKLLIK